MKASTFSVRQLSSTYSNHGDREMVLPTSPFLDFFVTFCVKTKSKRSSHYPTTAAKYKSGNIDASEHLEPLPVNHITNFLYGSKAEIVGNERKLPGKRITAKIYHKTIIRFSKQINPINLSTYQLNNIPSHPQVSPATSDFAFLLLNFAFEKVPIVSRTVGIVKH